MRDMNTAGTTTGRPRIRALGNSADLDALAAYFEVHAVALRRFAYWLCGDWAFAEDLVQDAFVRAARAGAKADREGILTYCRRTISSLHTSGMRRRTLEQRLLRGGTDREPVQAATDPSDRDEMWRHLMTLSAQQRACLVLRFYEDLTEAEIAGALGVSEGTVRKQVSRGMERLRTMVGRDA